MPSFRFVLEFDCETNDDAKDYGKMLERMADTITDAFPRLQIVNGPAKVQFDMMTTLGKL